MKTTKQDIIAFMQQFYPPPTARINFGTNYHYPIGPQGVDALLQYLNWNIQQINIAYHKTGNQGFQKVIEHQKQEKKAWTNLQEMIASKNGITSQGLHGLDKVLWPNLLQLRFNQNKIDHIGMSIIIKADFQNLKKMFISQNNIGVSGCQFLSHSKWPNLQRLDLNYNLITNEGLSYLILAQWPKLKGINIANNKIDSAGAYYLQKARWPQLQLLNVSRNYIGLSNESHLTDLGCVRISKMLTKKIKSFSMCKYKEKQLEMIQVQVESSSFSGQVSWSKIVSQVNMNLHRTYEKSLQLG